MPSSRNGEASCSCRVCWIYDYSGMYLNIPLLIEIQGWSAVIGFASFIHGTATCSSASGILWRQRVGHPQNWSARFYQGQKYRCVDAAHAIRGVNSFWGHGFRKTADSELSLWVRILENTCAVLLRSRKELYSCSKTATKTELVLSMFSCYMHNLLCDVIASDIGLMIWCNVEIHSMVQSPLLCLQFMLMQNLQRACLQELFSFSLVLISLCMGAIGRVLALFFYNALLLFFPLHAWYSR